MRFQQYRVEREHSTDTTYGWEAHHDLAITIAISNTGNLLPDLWVITHVRTGYRLPGRYDNVERALISVNALADLDWSFNTADNLPTATNETANKILQDLHWRLGGMHGA